LTQARDSYK